MLHRFFPHVVDLEASTLLLSLSALAMRSPAVGDKVSGGGRWRPELSCEDDTGLSLGPRHKSGPLLFLIKKLYSDGLRVGKTLVFASNVRSAKRW
jgi:hypothetical protein